MIKFKRKVYIIKNRTKDPTQYQRAITIPMEISRELKLNKGDVVLIQIQKLVPYVRKKSLKEILGGTPKVIGVSTVQGIISDNINH